MNSMKLDEVLDKIATEATDDADMEAVLDFYYEGQREFLNTLTGSDLEDFVEEHYPEFLGQLTEALNES